jgi:hypothetical protein
MTAKKFPSLENIIYKGMISMGGAGEGKWKTNYE